MAADILQEAAKRFSGDPDVQFGMARAWARSDATRAALAWKKTLQLNPRHTSALLFKVDRFVDSEQFVEAEKWIDRVLGVNPHHAQAWAYRAVLAHLSNDPRGEAVFRDKAQGVWKRNPAVEHLIGRKLSQKYRFAEGAAYQRRALQFDPNYLPARIQLCQDLLRLGREEEGWKLAEAVHESDGYEVLTFNLVELRDQIARFRTMENDDFILRMQAREADIYGDRALRLLGRAKKVLCGKYGLELKEKVTVEIFPDEDDFAVRTFGMPAVSGFLGVCFGKVITANSPASRRDNPSNWEAVLWHEFCHVVTLQLTHNKMPRWLSEGISVYEELQANSIWGQRMNPQYREMVLGGQLTPLGNLSSAFLSPKSPLHLQFAYYESALVVEFLVEKYGLEALKNVLRDLGAGLPIHVALERRTAPLVKLERDFEEFATARATKLGPKADWEKSDLPELLIGDGDVVQQLATRKPNNFLLLTLLARNHLEKNEWQQAKAPLKKLIELCPSYTGSDNAYRMLARVHRELNETDRERVVLKQYAALEADAVHTYLRLIELEGTAENWKAVRRNALRVLAVDPLIPQPHRALAEASEKLGETEAAIAAYRTLFTMKPDDPAEISYRLARLLHRRGDPLAMRYVLLALEEAPRFRAAHQLLLQINRRQH